MNFWLKKKSTIFSNKKGLFKWIKFDFLLIFLNPIGIYLFFLRLLIIYCKHFFVSIFTRKLFFQDRIPVGFYFSLEHLFFYRKHHYDNGQKVRLFFCSFFFKFKRHFFIARVLHWERFSNIFLSLFFCSNF